MRLYRLIRFLPGCNSRRIDYSSLSSRQAALALRPFYYAVHPDRFYTNPEVRDQNEKSLQLFNGYLNELLSTQRTPNPLTVHFFIASKESGKMRKIKLSLVGADPAFLISTALESCGLMKRSVPKKRNDDKVTVQTFAQTEQHLAADFEELLQKYRKKNASYQLKENSFIDFLKKQRDVAVELSAKFNETVSVLENEINDFKVLTGVSEVVWSSNYAMSLMRVLLSAVKRLIDASDAMVKGTNSICSALNGETLRFGNGSFVCIDGSLQFGVNSVPESWAHVCSGAHLRKAELPKLHLTVSHLSQVFGGAEMVLTNERPLSKTLRQLQVLNKQIEMQTKAERVTLETLARETLIEIMPTSQPVMIRKDGRLLVPSDVSFPCLLSFLQGNAQASRELLSSARKLEGKIKRARHECINLLKVSDVTWEEGFSPNDLYSSLKRLLMLDESVIVLVKGLSLHLSSNPVIYLMNDGRISIPLSWNV